MGCSNSIKDNDSFDINKINAKTSKKILSNNDIKEENSYKSTKGKIPPDINKINIKHKKKISSQNTFNKQARAKVSKSEKIVNNKKNSYYFFIYLY